MAIVKNNLDIAILERKSDGLIRQRCKTAYYSLYHCYSIRREHNQIYLLLPVTIPAFDTAFLQ